MALGLSHAVLLRGSLLWQTECNIPERLYGGQSILESQCTPCVSVCVGVLEQPKVPDRGWSYISAKSTKMPWVVGEGKGKGGLER